MIILETANIIKLFIFMIQTSVNFIKRLIEMMEMKANEGKCNGALELPLKYNFEV